MSLYLDSASTTPIHPDVQARMDELNGVFGNSNSKHVAGYKAQEIIQQSLQTIADVLNVAPQQLIPTYGGTDANRKVLWAFHKRFSSNELYCSWAEHSSIRDFFPEIQQFNPFDISSIPPTARMISLMRMNNETGALFEADTIKNTHPHSIVLSDWVQAFGKTNLNLAGIDFASFSAHKIYGPKTVGILYARSPELYPDIMRDTHTKNPQLIAGMAQAFTLIDKTHQETLTQLTQKLSNFIVQNFPQARILHSEKEKGAGIVSVSFPHIRGSHLMARLSDEEHICVSTGSACSSDLLSVNPVIGKFESDSAYQYPIRIGLHSGIQESDIDYFCEVLLALIQEMS